MIPSFRPARRAVATLLLPLLLPPLLLAEPARAREVDHRALRLGGAEPEEWSLGALIDRLAEEKIDVLFLGERHDNVVHHQLQARVVAEIAAAPEGRPVAGLAFEMIAPEQEAAAQKARGWPTAASAAQSRAVGEAVGWDGSGWPDWALYAPILEAAPRAYVAGGLYPRQALMAAAGKAKGTDWIAEEPEAARFGLDRPLPAEEQAAREAGQIKAHCDALPAEVAPRLVASQRARDARLAAAVLRARERAADAGLEGPVIVITGAGHARRDVGAAGLLARAAPELKIVSLGFIETEDPGSEAALQAAAEEGAGAFDVVAPTEGQEREDPCAAFRKS